MVELFNCFSEITKDAYKSAAAAATGTGAGYVPEIVSNSQGNAMSSTDQYIQYSVWAVTFIMGVFAIINAIQKQIDRYEKRKNKQPIVEPDEEQD